ncbi:MOSC domain containing protein [Planctopirus limnophila DSM 3776]|uniref:MOSC domain containing protein n=1 Tax=Planctopirus limnophila (strain ATCC 43296 / DSM 3776 / IFAM 1008 / Mu 290) TaxID=521674 RepID=D5SVV9_PLAL2|nr:MOSC domain-containing protein [Planctopirus limnophila]ADG69469.1 MOSC domain containing protein [Planctopirus limnophila DSM 3776]
MPLGHITSLQVGRPQQRPALSDRQPAYWTGFWKSPVTGRLLLDAHGLEGDGQADLINHGGTDKALCIYAALHYPAWKTTLQRDDFSYGAFGENLTVSGETLHEAEVCVGDLWAIGTARLQVSQPRQPCWKLGRRWEMTDLPGKVIQTGKTGWYLRVIQPGTLAQGDEITLIARPAPAWPISRLNQLMYREKQNISLLKEALALPFLSTSWRDTFMSRLHSS